MCLAIQANAEPYFYAGFGQSQMKHVESNKWWYQEGYDHLFEEKANAYLFGVGHPLNKYLSIEVDYRDLGEYNAFAGFVEDSEYNDLTLSCFNPCANTKWSWQHGEAKGLGISFLGKTPGNFYASIRAGSMYVRSRFEVHHSSIDPKSVHMQTANGGLNTNKWVGMYGVGVGYKKLSLEFTRYGSLGAQWSALGDAETVTVRYEFGF